MDSVGAFWISSGLLDNIELNITEDGLLNMTLEDLDVGDVQVKSGSSCNFVNHRYFDKFRQERRGESRSREPSPST